MSAAIRSDVHFRYVCDYGIIPSTFAVLTDNVLAGVSGFLKLTLPLGKAGDRPVLQFAWHQAVAPPIGLINCSTVKSPLVAEIISIALEADTGRTIFNKWLNDK